MRAPDLETLLNIPANLENDFLNYFGSVGLNAIGTGATDNLTENTIAVRVSVDGAQGHEMKASVTGTGEQEQDWFNCTLYVSVSTAEKDDHDLRVSFAKKAMLRGSLNGKVIEGVEFLSDYYWLNGISFTGQSDTVTDLGTSNAEITYSLLVCIQEAAWSGNTAEN